MNSEKAKEIKKVLECCINDCSGNSCPYNKYEKGLKCIDDLQKDALTLINELEKENKILCNAKVVYETIDYCYEDLKKAENRIAELENGIAKSMLSCEFLPDCTNEKLKQFADRLKEKMYENENGYIEFLSGKNAIAVDIVDFENCLDETLKEFIK